jgi:hypothetical protein
MFAPCRLLWVGLGAALLAALPLRAAADRVVKVLPHYLDTAGRHALSPSLFERDAYQTLLRAHPEKRGGLRFDVQWKARRAPGQARRLRLELVSTTHPRSRPLVIEAPLPEKRSRGWTALTLDAPTERALGDWTAWRVSLVVDDREVSSRQSFLW